MSKLKSLAVGVVVVALIAVASAATLRFASESRGRVVAQGPLRASQPAVSPQRGGDPMASLMEFNRGNGVTTPAVAAKAGDPASRGTFIVVMEDAPVASYRGGVRGIPTPRLAKRAGGKPRMDMRSEGAIAYAKYLQQRQARFERTATGMVGRPIGVRMRMQHAVSAVVMDLSNAEADRLRAMPGVRFIEPYRLYTQDTDTGPALIGAPALWSNSSPFVPASYKGEGMVVGVIDSGINFGSPSFAAVDPIDGYVHVNPLGSDNYIGTCSGTGPDVGRCNSKLIGGHDFVCNYTSPGGATAAQCGATNSREEPGFGDTNSHGTHVAGTVAGNNRDAVLNGTTYRISGVAPRANIIAYDVCYTDTASGRGSCPNVSTVAAINQTVIDGIVDVINYSISGGVDPWLESTSLAFLGAVDAGIYVAASAGNSGPGPDTMGHHEPWVASTAAAQHGKGGLGLQMVVTAPTPVPANLAAVTLTESSGGVTFSTSLPGTTPLRISSGINGASDGCSAFPAGTFTGSIAVVRRGTCNFSVKVNNAAAAGAVAVIIANNAAGVIAPTLSGTTVPAFSVTQADGDALRNFGQANPATARAGISSTRVRVSNTPDQLAAFSSRGPAASYNLVKPDITAPGVDVLAAVSGETLTGSEQAVALFSGTSMSSPHHAGAALLIRQAHPTWTPVEVRSALQMTATRSVLLEDGATPATPFAMGSGRIRLDRAVRAGLVMNETTANFSAANPATGGQEWTLNLPSMARRSCWPSCTFTRTFRNPTTSGILWRASVEGLPGTVSPAFAWIPPGGTQAFQVTVDTSALPNNGTFAFASVLLEHRVTGGGVDAFRELRLPVAVAVQPPALSLPASAAAASNGVGGYALSFNVQNVGGSPLTWAYTNSGSAALPFASNSSQGVSSGFRNTTYANPIQANPQSLGQYSADDFVVSSTTRITSLSVEGFLPGGAQSLAVASTSITWSIFADANNDGLPDGHPLSGTALWSHTSTATGPGVSTGASGTDPSLDLDVAGLTLNLAPGRYFLVVSTDASFLNRFAQYASNTQSGNAGFVGITVATNGTGTWSTNTAFPGLTMRVVGTAPCGASWLTGMTPSSGTLQPGATTPLTGTVNATGLTAGTYGGAACFTSNDPLRPTAAVPVSLTIP